MGCIFDVNNLQTSLSNLEEDLIERLSPFAESGLKNEQIKNEVLREIGEISQDHLINSTNVDQALPVFDGEIREYFEEEMFPSMDEIKNAMLAWTKTPDLGKEDTSSRRLDNLEKNILRVKEDPLANAYGRALKAKIRAEQHANSVGVHSILFNEEGIIDGVNELNHAIELQQEELLKKVIEYLKNKIPDFKYSDSRMYENGVYTGIVEKLQSEYESEFKFNFNELNNLYNNNQLDILDAYSSWVILQNFDTILKLTFGKAINIDNNKSKYNIGKYSVAGGSNVYATWRTNEEIDLSKEVNNITQAIIKSLPYYTADSATPDTTRNLKFNEFVYIMSKIKELPLHAKSDFIISSVEGLKEEFKTMSLNTLNLLNGKSIFLTINLLRNNPLKYLPAIMEILNNKTIFNYIVSNIDNKYFASVDRDLINTIYQGLFSEENPSSLLSIQRLRKGFQGTNYYSFITLTIDSMFKSNFLQYFRNPDGEIYVRNMYDLSLYNIEQTIRQTINRFNSTLIANNYKSIVEKYNPSDNIANYDILLDSSIKTLADVLVLDGVEYNFVVGENSGVRLSIIRRRSDNALITDSETLNKLGEIIKSKYAKPEIVTYHINNFHRGPLTIKMNIRNGKIDYLVNGIEDSFHGKSDYDSLSEVIQDILQLNFDISPDYLEAYKNRVVGSAEGIDRFAEPTRRLMDLVTRVITNQYILENYIKNSTDKYNRVKNLYTGDYQVSYNRNIGEIDFLGKSDTETVKDLAEANALVTGRLTSSQILDGEGNALASSTLSRLVNSVSYLVETQVKNQNSAAKDFILWNPGVYKGVSLLKELKDNKSRTSKSSTAFSNKELETSLVFIDFLHGLINPQTELTKTPFADGIVGFYPSENSDKTFVGRLMIDLKNVLVGDSNLYLLIKTDPSNIIQFYPIIAKLLGDFYEKVLNNINSEWNRVLNIVDEYIIDYNNKVLNGDIPGGNVIVRNSPISYGNWDTLKQLAEVERQLRLTEKFTLLDFLNEIITKHNNENPNDLIVLRDLIHYVWNKKEEKLLVNNSLVANYNRFVSADTFAQFINQQNIDVLESLLKDEVSINSNKDIKKLVKDEWIDKFTDKVILGKYADGTVIKHISDLNKNRKDIILNPLIAAYNTLNYFFTLEYMNSSVGAYYAHPNKKHKDLSLLSGEQKLAEQLLDEKARKLALDKRNVDFTASMHAFLKNLIQGIPNEINVAIIPNSHDDYETIIGIKYDMDADDGACYSNPFYQILQNNSLGGARVGLIKKTFTHFYDEKTGTAGIFKDAEFPLTNEWIRRSLRYQKMMRNMTDRIWRNQDGTPAVVDITTDYKGNPIEFINPNCTRQGLLFYRDSTDGNYYAFWIKKGSQPNSYIKTVQLVDENGMAQSGPVDLEEEIIDTNYKLWNFLGGAYSMEIKPGSNKLSYCESSINMVVKIMNNTTSEGAQLPDVIETQEDIWQPLKHADIHLMPTVGAVKMGIANINSEKAYEEANPDGVNFFKIKTDQMGIQLDKEHHADGEDLSIMTLVISACASRGYTPEQTLNLYNALASLARAGIKPYIKNFELFFKVSSKPNASVGELREARQRFENVLLDTLVKALANSTNDSVTLQMVTLELLNAAKEGKDISYADLKVPLSDPGVMRKLHSTISVALTRAAIKIKVDGSLNMLCPSNGIIKVYGGKMGNEFINSSEILELQTKCDNNPELDIVNIDPQKGINILHPERIKLGRHYKVIERGDNNPIIKFIKHPGDYYKFRREIVNGKYLSVKELFAPTTWEEQEKPTTPHPDTIISQIDKQRSLDDKIEKAIELKLIERLDLYPRNLDEQIISRIGGLSKASIALEVWGTQAKNVKSELNKLVDIHKGGTKTVSLLAEQIAGESLGTEWETTDDYVRDIIIDTLRSASTSSDITLYIKKSRLQEGIDRYIEEYELELDYLEDHKEVHYFEGGRELGAYNVTFTGKLIPVNESPLIVTGKASTTAAKALEIGGIDTLRHPDANGMHFGNPFSHLKTEVQPEVVGKAKVLTPTVREAVIAFELWLNGTAYLDIEPERRQWILDQINNGSLIGKPLVYYTNTVRDSEGTHYYNPETFPNHAQILLKYINAKADELAGPLFSREAAIEKGFNLYDLVSVLRLHDLQEAKAPKHLIDEAMANLQKDLTTLHGKEGLVETVDGFVNINPKSIEIEPYEIVMPKIFATVFGLTVNDDLSAIKSDPLFFTKRLIEHLNTIPETKTNEEGEASLTYTIALQKINGQHTYILNANDAIRTDNFRPKEFLQIREKGKLYRKIGDDLAYEINEGDLIWEYVDLDGNSTEIIVTDNVTSYLDRVDYATININNNNSSEFKEQFIKELRNSENKSVQHYLEMVDYLMETREGELLDYAIEDILDISINNYNDHPLAKYFTKLGNEVYASFLKSLEIVAARVPAQSMQSFMPMKVVGFEGSDINTAYVSTTLMLFQGSDYDIDAVSLASYAFDRSGRYIIHSPLANIENIGLLKASLELPFPTGEIMEVSEDNVIDYNSVIRIKSEKELKNELASGNITLKDFDLEMAKPFYMQSNGKTIVYNTNVDAINNLSKFINKCNKLGYIPGTNNPYMSIAVNNFILRYINKHNDYINTSKDVEEFSKNYIVTAMFNIGLSPANLIESQAALDSITAPLKEAANSTLKAMQTSMDNPGNYTTNVHGLVQNMDGKQGVGICAVGLKGYFAAVARYNEVLNNGTPEEVKRLQSDVEIAGKRFRMLANVYTTNEVNQAILGEIITQLDLTNDVALTLSALLSLATDNAKELALSKLNAANMLGMYIYGISIGMDFRDISKVIASNTGIIIDSLMKEDSIAEERGMSMENIFDYIELGPNLSHSKKISDVVKNRYEKVLNKETLRKLAWEGEIKVGDNVYNFLNIVGSNRIYDLAGAINFLEQFKLNPPSDSTNEFYDGIIEYNRNVEKAQRYLEHLNKITGDLMTNTSGRLIYYNGNLDESIYGNIKKLYAGGEEMRTLGKILHINQGNETSYASALNYIETVESAMVSRQYLIFRETARYKELNGEKRPTDFSKNYRFNFHDFIFDESYRSGVIDLYSGICNEAKFNSDESYRRIFKQVYPNENYENIAKYITYSPSKVFINILDVVQVPHYMEYLKSADMLFLYMSNSIKYRGIYKLGKRAIDEIGAHSLVDKENIFKRTEQFIDRLMRDRFFFSQNILYEIPEGIDSFEYTQEGIKRIPYVEGRVQPNIRLGTVEGNATFKLLMEDKIIPELQKMERFKDNRFIQSLKPTLFTFNPELQTTICRAPNINMSPRSDTDSALFEEIKHDFNKLRTESYKYPLGMFGSDLIELFYYYNMIAFGGRVGENTLTNIFQDVLDYKNIKVYRDFESKMDKDGNFELSDKENGIEGTITLDTLLREVAPRASSFSTNLNYFYEENSNTGKLEFKERNRNRYMEDPDTGNKITGDKYIGSPINYITEDSFKNYILESTNPDIMGIKYTYKNGDEVHMVLERGVVSEITLNGNLIELSLEDKAFFRNLKMIPSITSEGILLDYDKNSILSKVDEIISCKI